MNGLLLRSGWPNQSSIVSLMLLYPIAIHGDCVKLMLNVDRFVGSSLVGLYSKCTVCFEDARRVFDEMTDRDVVAYTSIVTGLLKK